MIFSRFFRRKKSANRSRNRQVAPVSQVSSRRSIQFRLVPALLLIGIGTLVAGSYSVWQFIWPRVQTRPEYQISLSDIWITPPPPWIQSKLITDIHRWNDLPETLSLLDHNLTKKLAHVFSRHPWIQTVNEVRITQPGRVEVRVDYRKPVAVVETSKGSFTISAGAVLLPREGLVSSTDRPYPVIAGINKSPDLPEGHVWDDPLVQGGAQLAEILIPHWNSLQLESLEATLLNSVEEPESQPDEIPRNPSSETKDRTRDTRKSEGLYSLITKGGTRIIWGRSPNTSHPAEIPAQEKIVRLQEYVERFGSLTGPDGPYELDIRHWKELSRRPRTADDRHLR